MYGEDEFIDRELREPRDGSAPYYPHCCDRDDSTVIVLAHSQR
ncbi:hypothetical protein [Streptomyces celluloflavus]